jgi:Xaa-Pro aminopeptidase
MTPHPETLTKFALSETERDRRWTSVRREMERQGLDCLVVQGSYACFRDANQNLQYLANVGTEGFLLFPRDGAPTLYSFENGFNPTWVPDWRGAIPFFGKALAKRIEELGLQAARFGLVGLSGLYGEYGGFPHTTWRVLTDAFPRASFEDATALVEDIRRTKSDEELRCLELGCEAMEEVFRAVAATAGVGVADYEVRAVIMDTLYRRGCEPGSMILYCQGKDVVHGGQSGGWNEPPFVTPLEPGDVILIELDAVYAGYKAQFNAAFSVGEPDEVWAGVFATGIEAFEAGVEVLRPAITLGELEDALLEPIKRGGYVFGNPAFHGLGLGLESPIGTYPRVGYEVDRSITVDAGWVFEFEPHPVTPDGKRGASIGCPVVVTDAGCRLLPPTWKPEVAVV